MTTYSAKDAIVLIKGYNLSTYATSFETEMNVNPLDVTAFTDGSKNFIPGLPSATIRADMFWSSTSGATHTALSALGAGHVTILPQGYALGNMSLSMPYTQVNYSPKGTPDSALSIGSIEIARYGSNEGVENGYVLAHATITNTATATVYGSYADLLTFTANGSAVTSERQTAVSGTINKFIRVLATRTGSASNSF